MTPSIATATVPHGAAVPADPPPEVSPVQVPPERRPLYVCSCGDPVAEGQLLCDDCAWQAANPDSGEPPC